MYRAAESTAKRTRDPDSKHRVPVANNLRERRFTPAAPNRIWTADLTYLWTDEGWVYLAAVLDLFNGEIVGYSIEWE